MLFSSSLTRVWRKKFAISDAYWDYSGIITHSERERETLISQPLARLPLADRWIFHFCPPSFVSVGIHPVAMKIQVGPLGAPSDPIVSSYGFNLS